MSQILLIVAVVLFILAGLDVWADRTKLGWFGMACFAGAFLIGSTVL